MSAFVTLKKNKLKMVNYSIFVKEPVSLPSMQVPILEFLIYNQIKSNKKSNILTKHSFNSRKEYFLQQLIVSVFLSFF